MARIKAGINTTKSNWEYVFSDETVEKLSSILDFDGASISEQQDEDTVVENCRGAEVILSTWGAIPYSPKILQACPDLKLILYGAGAFKGYVTDELIDAGVTVCSAMHLNAIPTAEFSLALILVSLKDAFLFNGTIHEQGRSGWGKTRDGFSGGYYKTCVGLLGYGAVSRHLMKLLRGFEMNIYISDDFITEEEADQHGATKTTTEWIMENCDVVSVHHADVPKNWNLINAETLALMKPGARLVNTSRGRMIDEDALVAKLKGGSISAYLDVTHPEPPAEGHPFYSLPNCILTPHVAGSIGAEVHRMGDYCYRELENWLEGKPLENEVNIRDLEFRT